LESTLPAVALRLREWTGAGGDSEGVAGNSGASAATAARAGADAATTRTDAGKYRLVQVEAELADQDGRLCTTQDRLVQVSVSGPGKLLGLENGDLSDCAEYAAPARRLYRGRLVIYVLAETGAEDAVSLTARAEGLTAARASL
jgi:hypothetical protein